jgi:N6-adenosine-specific RNA methylase IME4
LKTADKLAAEHGVGSATVRRAGKFAEEVDRTPELKQAVGERRPVIQVKRELKEQAREARREENRKKIAAVPEPEKAAAVADAKFATIVIDPPWDWGDEGDQDQLGRARPDYSTMTIEQLEQLDVGGLADDDCHIYLWITNRSLPKGFRLLEAWGFRYITAITWVKPHFGMGNYFRGQTEHVLFGVKGSQPLKRKDVGTAFMADRGTGGHSSKPSTFLDLVESCSPGPYIEMFSRSSRNGWITWGEQSHGAA